MSVTKIIMRCHSSEFCVARELVYWFGLFLSLKFYFADYNSVYYDRDGEGQIQVQSRNPGSRLKTPGLPIWVWFLMPFFVIKYWFIFYHFQVTNCMGHFGIIFNSNRELLRNYHAEKRFELHHYTCAGCFVSMVDWMSSSLFKKNIYIKIA